MNYYWQLKNLKQINMSERSDNFKRNLEALISLFKKFREKLKKEELIGVDKSLFSHIDLLIDNYDTIRNNFPDDVFEQMGEPLQQMMIQAITQLKSEFPDINQDSDKEFVQNLIHVDELLKNPNLTQKEIDELLDKRSGINS